MRSIQLHNCHMYRWIQHIPGETQSKIKAWKPGLWGVCGREMSVALYLSLPRCVCTRTRRYGAKGEHNSVDAQHTCRPHMAVQVLRGAAAGALTCRVLDLP